MAARPRPRGGEGPVKFFLALIDGLVAHAEHAFAYNLPRADGTTLQAHLEAAWTVTGKQPPGLADVPELPIGALSVWSWFLELSAARRSSGFGISPIVWADVAAFFSLKGTRPRLWEIAALRALDNAFIRAAAEAAREREGAKRAAGR